jgi:hypothetical protein
MKKLFVIFASVVLVAAFAVSATAADWSLYGNARMATFWDDTDTGAPGGDDEDLQWDLQGNSRVGATVKNENINARVELALKGGGGGDDVDVGTRRIEATWDMGGAKLTIGKTYTGANQFVSGQVFGGDRGLLGNGCFYSGRPGQIKLAIADGMFDIAAAQPKTDNAPAGLLATDVDETLPKFEAAFHFKADMFFFNIIGGWQSYDIEGGAGVSDVSIDSTVFGADAGFNFGPAYVKVAASIITNGGNARWSGGTSATANAAGTDVDDVDSMQYALIAGFKASDMATFEAGYGFREHDSDAAGVPDDEETAYYVQAVLQVAPGFFIIPEIGGYDDTGALDQGDEFYFGAKWQINF